MKYMEAFKPMLTLALKNTEEYQVHGFHFIVLLIGEEDSLTTLPAL